LQPLLILGLRSAIENTRILAGFEKTIGEGVGN
jgi:hypothetical protein